MPVCILLTCWADMLVQQVHMLLIEPTGTPNTGDKRTAAPRKRT
jgi:hypothetical protein